VPLVSVQVRVAPEVNASWIWKVPPTPLNVNGREMVTPFELIVFVPVVAANVKVPAASGTVIPDVDNFKLPKIVITELFHVPPNPAEVVPSVKSKSRYEPAVRVSAAVLLVNLNEILLASVTAVGVIVLAVVVTVAVQII